MKIPQLLLPAGCSQEQHLRDLHEEIANFQFRKFLSHGEVLHMTTLDAAHLTQLWQRGLLPRIQFEDQIIYRFCDVEPVLYAMFRPFPRIWPALHQYIFGYTAESVLYVSGSDNVSWFYEGQLFPTCFREGLTWASDDREDPRVLQLRAFVETLTANPTSEGAENSGESRASQLLTKYYPMWGRGEWHATHLPDGVEREIR
ncbi:hypothetical protein DUE52_31290 [Larkinella punicea]|uniref:Uncharacterized protein n=2 Tax=Larkinella punicea TaxID=2315727 RepID=A0A368JHH7_9BACT|nr:hypothetical protein DUE52_31290 [Larkinella punicea]